MKKHLLLISFALLVAGGVSAQENTSSQSVDSLQRVVADLNEQMQSVKDAERNEAVWKNRAKYFNIGFSSQKLSPVDAPAAYGDAAELKSDLGVALVWGRTYYLHKKPLARMIKFGIDFSWMDINYAKYSLPEYAEGGTSGWAGESGDELSLSAHQLEYGMQVGPSVTINPVDHLKAGVYFRYVPSASLMVLEDEVNANFASFFTAGGAVSYKLISIGVEGRWGRANYKNFALADELEDAMDGDVIQTSKSKWKTGGVRVYVSFRF